jgi:hypothetical protein
MRVDPIMVAAIWARIGHDQTCWLPYRRSPLPTVVNLGTVVNIEDVHDVSVVIDL